MATTASDIPGAVHDLFPKSATKAKRVRSAWHPERSSLERPETHGTDGWSSVSCEATRAELDRLRQQGYTWVTIETGGVANPRRDVPLAALL